jgi:hypothetical protein
MTASPQMPRPAALLLAQVRYELRLLLRNPRALAAGVLVPVVLLVLRRSDGSDLDAAVAGLTVLGVTLTAYTTHAIGLVTSRNVGVLRRWRSSPLPSWCYLTGRIAATVTMALGSAAVSMLAAVAVLDAPLEPREVLLALVVLAAGAVAWAALGTAISRVIVSTEAAWADARPDVLPADGDLRGARTHRRTGLAHEGGALPAGAAARRRHRRRPPRRPVSHRSRPPRARPVGCRRAGRIGPHVPVGPP